MTASCQYMTDFREKSILLDGVSGTFSNANSKVKEDSEGKLQLHSLYPLCHYYQVIVVVKPRISARTTLGYKLIFPLSNLKRIPSSADKQRNKEPFARGSELTIVTLGKVPRKDTTCKTCVKSSPSQSKWSTIA